MRRPHWLSRQGGGELPRLTFFIDTETRETPLTGNKVHAQFWFGFAAFCRRRIATIWDETQWLRFTDPLDVWKWIDEKIPKKSKAYIFAHNLAFDMPTVQFLDNLRSLGWYLTKFILDDPPSMLEFEHCRLSCGIRSGASWRKKSKCPEPHRKIVILDTLNYFRMSLAELGDQIGSDKLPMPAQDAPEPEWDKYTKQDVNVLILTMQNYLAFIQKHDLGNFAITQASQSFTAYRHRFMVHRIFIDNNEKALALSRASYAGGRVEAFRLGRIPGPVYKLDVNSMYPAVMHSESYPVQLMGFWQNVTLSELKADVIRQNYGAIADVQIETDEPSYPVRDPDGRLIFPIGTFRTQLAGPELEYAYGKGHIRRIDSLALYQMAPIFVNFVDYFYRLRLAAKERGDNVNAFFLKIMMNSLYGKFGQNGRKWQQVEPNGIEQVRCWLEYDGDTGEVVQYRQVGHVVQALADSAESLNSHPAIASYITSHARMRLWNLITQAGRENVFYIDTDSLMVNDDGNSRLADQMDGVKLGMLKVEKQASFADVRGLKDYSIGNETRIKGVRNPDRIAAPGVYFNEVFRGWRGMMRENDLSKVVITKGTKRLSRRYQKGNVTESGSVEPFVLHDVAAG